MNVDSVSNSPEAAALQAKQMDMAVQLQMKLLKAHAESQKEIANMIQALGVGGQIDTYA